MNNSSIAACAAHGLPVITTHNERPEPEFVDGENVLLCNAKDAGALAEGMLKVLNDPPLADRLRKGSADLTGRYFSWDATLNSTQKVFDEALKEAVREPA